MNQKESPIPIPGMKYPEFYGHEKKQIPPKTISQGILLTRLSVQFSFQLLILPPAVNTKYIIQLYEIRVAK